MTYIHGATGFGKTELIKQFLKNKEYDYKSCLENENLSKISKDIVIIDDIQFLDNEVQKQQIISLIENPNIWLVLIGGSSMPNWLLPFHVKHTFLLISEKDLSLSKDDIAKYLLLFDITLSDEDLETLATQSQGNAYVINQTIIHLLAGNHIDSDTMKFIEKSINLGNFMKFNKHKNIYTIRPQLLQALRNRAIKVYGSEDIKQYYYNAGLYYEVNDMISLALEMYEKCDNK